MMALRRFSTKTSKNKLKKLVDAIQVSVRLYNKWLGFCKFELGYVKSKKYLCKYLLSSWVLHSFGLEMTLRGILSASMSKKTIVNFYLRNERYGFLQYNVKSLWQNFISELLLQTIAFGECIHQDLCRSVFNISSLHFLFSKFSLSYLTTSLVTVFQKLLRSRLFKTPLT